MLTLYFVLLICASAYGRTDEELKAEFIKILMECTTDHPVEMTELVQLQNLVVPKKKEVKCLLACTYRKEGSMNAKGMYDLEHAYKLAVEENNGDKKREENAKKFADFCVKVNDEAVSDGEKGCERAAIMFKCLVENAHKYGFKV